MNHQFTIFLIWYDYNNSSFFLEATDDLSADITIGRMKQNPNNRLKYWKIPFPRDCHGYLKNINKESLSSFILDASQDPEIDQGKFLNFIKNQFSIPGDFNPFIKISR